MSRSDHASGQMSTYRFPGEVAVDELLVRGPVDADIEEIAPAFRDPAVGGEASLPPVDADTLRVMVHDQLPGMRAQGLLAAYVIEDKQAGALLGGAEAHVRIGNAASERVLERLGFEREGVKRKYLRHGGGRVDAMLFVLLADDA